MTRYLIAALAACAVLILLGWQHIGSQGKDLAAAQGKVATLEAAAASRRNTQRLLLELDTKHTRELTNAQNTNAQLRAAVATGKRRLSVQATCPAVGATTSPTGMDDDQARAELDPAAAERIVAIASDGDDAIRALNGLQEYVFTACTPRE